MVFLHGLVGLNEHWEGVVDRVKSRVRCILFELPLLQMRGEDCSIHGVTRLTTQFLREYVAQPAVLVGNSFGGHVALRIALEAPEVCRGLVLAGSSGLIEKSMVSDIQIRPSREWLVRKIGELFYDQSKMREADIDRAYRELSDRGRARAMVKLSRLRAPATTWATASATSAAPRCWSGAATTSSRPRGGRRLQPPHQGLAPRVVRQLRPRAR